MINWIRTHRLSAAQELGQEPSLRKDRRLVFCLVTVLLWGLAAHSYGFFNCNFSHDSLNAFYATPREDQWKLENGRFIVPVYRALFRGNFALPWLIGLLALVFIGLSLYLMARMLKLHSPLLLVLAGGIMSVNLSIIAQTATYIHELDCNCLALLLAVGAVYLWYFYRGWLPFLGSAVLVFLSLGIYQSYFSAAATLMIFLSLMGLLQGEDVARVFLRGLRGIAILLTGILGYCVCSEILCRLLHVSATYEIFEQSVNIFHDLPKLIGGTYSNFFQALNNPAYPDAFRVVLYLVDFLLLAELACILFRQRKEPVRLLLTAALLVVLPFVMDITFLLAQGDQVHDLTYFSVWLVWLLYLLVTFLPTASPVKGRWPKVVCVILVAMILWQNVVFANTAYMKKEVAEKATYSTMTRVLDRIEQREDYVYRETPVAFIGTGGGIAYPTEYGNMHKLVGLHLNDSIGVDTPFDFYNAIRPTSGM
ncbi:MAG: glucosyltransferase domain-containing protein [Eubacteriales bacterium]|nr:glucosyltransferase domain-containing protein [Eubacteriales bacterium]